MSEYVLKHELKSEQTRSNNLGTWVELGVSETGRCQDGTQNKIRTKTKTKQNRI